MNDAANTNDGQKGGAQGANKTLDAGTGGFELTEPKGKKGEHASPDMNFILDIPLEITIQLGKTQMLIHDLLKLGQGSIIELPKVAGETLEILANNRLIAKGDVVVINEKYGIRLTEVISPMERVETLK